MTYETITKLSNPKNYGVVIVDMQPIYLTSIESKDELISAQQDVLEVCIEKNIPVLAIEMGGTSGTIRRLRKKFEKSRYSYSSKEVSDGFDTLRKDVRYFLNELEITDLCLMGIWAYDCVEATAKGAYKNGFGVLTAEQLIANPWWRKDLDRTKEWFSRNGEYFKNYQDVLKLLRGK